MLWSISRHLLLGTSAIVPSRCVSSGGRARNDLPPFEETERYSQPDSQLSHILNKLLRTLRKLLETENTFRVKNKLLHPPVWLLLLW